MTPRLVVALMSLGAACAPAPEPATDRAAIAELQAVGGQGPAARLRIEEHRQGLLITDSSGVLPLGPVTLHVVDGCDDGDERVPTTPPTIDPRLAAPPEGPDAGTSAGMKGQRAASSEATADESGQAQALDRPTSASPPQRVIELTPVDRGWAGGVVTLEEILGRAVAWEGPSGRMCGEVRPSTTDAPAPAG